MQKIKELIWALCTALPLITSAQANAIKGSAKTVDDLLAVDNNEALKRAETRSFGKFTNKPYEQVLDSPAAQTENKSVSEPTKQAAHLYAVYGRNDDLRADINIGSKTIDGAKKGQSIGGCIISKITATQVDFVQKRGKACASLKWTGESAAHKPELPGSYLPAVDMPAPLKAFP